MITLKQIDESIHQALLAQYKPNGGPFSYVGRFAGALSTAEGAFSRILDRSPAVLVAFEGERVSNDFEQLTGDGEITGRSTWSVYLMSTDPRAIAISLDGASGGKPGVYDLLETIYSTLGKLILYAPAATLQIAVTGTPSATVDTTGLLLTYACVRYTPVDGSGNTLAAVTLDGAGAAAIYAICTTPNAAGDLLPGATLTWTPSAPAGLDATATCTAVSTPSAQGPIRNKRLTYSETRYVPVTGGRVYVMAVRYTVDRAIPQVAVPDTSTAYGGSTFKEHLVDDGIVPILFDPIVTGRDF